MSEVVKRIVTADAPAPKGHYSQATRFGDLIFISGQIPDFADANHKSAADQVRSAVGNMLAILRGAGGEPEDLLKVTAYIVGIEHWQVFNDVYAELLGAAKPARAIVPVPELHFGFMVEVEAVAARRER